MGKHTPGPWVIWKGSGTIVAGPVKENRPGLIRGGRGHVVDVEIDGFGDFSPSVAKANAKLIAAAPDLLEALRLMVNRAAPEEMPEKRWDECLKIARKALKLAGAL